MDIKKIRFVTMAASLLILAAVLAFNAWLNLTSLKKSYVDSLVSGYTVAGGECRKKIEYAVKYGKPLDNFYGIKELLQGVKNDVPRLDDVRVLLPDGKVIYNLEGRVRDGFLSPGMIRDVNFRGDAGRQNSIILQQEGKYYIFIPVRDRHNDWIGTLNLVFDQSIVSARVNLVLKQSLGNMIRVALLSALLLGLIMLLVPVVTTSGEIRKKRLFAILLGILGLAQAFYGYFNIGAFQKEYLDIAMENTRFSARIIQKDINQVLAKGVSYQEMGDIKAWLDTIIGTIKEIESVSIHDTAGGVLYSASAPGAVGYSQEPAREHTSNLLLDRSTSGEQGTLQVVLSKSYIDAKVKDLKLDLLTIIVTSSFLTVELILFLLFFIRMHAIRSGIVRPGEEEASSTKIIRPLAFLFFVAFDMSISFIPVQMKNLYEPILGLPKDIVLALPITAEMFCIALSAYFAGLMVDKKSWRHTFILGLAVVAAGILLSGLARSEVVFIMARAVTGLGYGFTLISMEGFLAVNPSKSDRAVGFSQLYAGIYAGKMCSVALGAMLAERLGYSPVFFIQLVALAIPLAFALAFAKAQSGYPAALRPAAHGERVRLADFLGNRQVLTLFLFIALPSMLCTVGFFCYFFPLYSNSIGLSASNTGRAFMIYSLCFVLLGPYLGKFIGRRADAKKFIYLSGCTGVLAMLVFFWQGSLAAALAAIFLLGLADSISAVAHTTYFLNLEATRSLGEGKGLGLFRMTRKIGEAMGPLAFGWVLVLGPQNGIGLIGLSYLLVIFMFFVSTRGKPGISSGHGL